MIRLPNNLKVKSYRKSDISTYGSGSTSGKYVYINTVLTKTGTNAYSLKINLSCSSSQVWNSDGINVYAHIGSQKILKGKSTISGGSLSVASYTHNFTVTANTSVKGSCADTVTSDARFNNETSADTATYTNPATAPTNAICNLSKTGIVEGEVVATASYTCPNPSGTTEFCFAYKINESGEWVVSPFSTTNRFALNVTSMQRGANFIFETRVKNGVGTSGWSPRNTITSNRLPNKVTNIRPSKPNPIGAYSILWDSATDPDGQAVTYRAFVSKNNGAFELVGAVSTNSADYDISRDPAGTVYKYYVDTIDSLGAVTRSDNSPTHVKGTPPSNPVIELNKTGTIEGSVTCTSTYTCPSPIGTIQYKYAYMYGTSTWQELGWSTTASHTQDLTSHRGVNWSFKVKMKNDAGESDWSAIKTVKSNSKPIGADILHHSPTYPVSVLNFNWQAATDPDGHTVTNKVYLKKGTAAYALLGSTSDRVYSYNCSSDPEGTRYRYKIESTDSLGAMTPSPESGEMLKPVSPTNVSFSSPSSGIHESNFNVTWNASNFSGLSGTYNLEKKVNNGAWTSVLSGTTATTFAFNIESINRGDSVVFRVNSTNEAGQSSAWVTSNTVSRNRLPNAVTNIGPNASYAVNIITFTWNAATDPDNQAVKYKIYLSKDGGAYTYLGETSATSYQWTMPTSDIGETTYRAKIQTVDTLGAYVEAIGPLIKKPTPPTAPTGLKPGNGYYEGNINLSWTASNFFEQTAGYVVDIYTNDVLLKTVAVSSPAYNLSLSGITRGYKIKYRVKARNQFNQESSWVESTANMYHNRIPSAPSVILPIRNTNIATRNPKIVIKSGTDQDSQTMSVNVKYNGTIYNSETHNQFFSKERVGNEEYIIFKHTTLLPVGANNIEVTTNDGLINSPITNHTLSIMNQMTLKDTGDYITKSYLSEVATLTNFSRVAYGLESTMFDEVTSPYFIEAKYITQIINSLTELTTSIDSYHPNSKLKYNYVYKTPVASNSVIEIDHFNQIANVNNTL